MKADFTNKGVGAMYYFFGYLENSPLHIFAMKEEYYEIMLMSTYGTNVQVVKTKLNYWRR